MYKLTFLLFIAIGFISFSQEKQENFYKQEYIYHDDGVNLKLRIDKYKVTSKDTLFAELEIFNESEKSIFVVPSFHYSYVMDELTSIPNGVYLDFGGGMSDDITSIPFEEIKHNKKKTIKTRFSCDNFRHDNFADKIYFSVWYGYLKPERIEDLKINLDSENKIYFEKYAVKYLVKNLAGSIAISFKK